MLLLPSGVQRLAQYESYLEAALQTRHDFDQQLSARAARPKQTPQPPQQQSGLQQQQRRNHEESDLERIQELFPTDGLCLHEKDAATMRMKGLMRKRSTTAARLQRALSNKSREEDAPAPQTPQQPPERQFLLEAAVLLTTGVQSQARHLFLFSDLLLVAKPRGGNFKLKEKVRVSEMWLARCVDDVSEVPRSHDTSFVLGWPTTNVVASFGTQAARDLWWSKLSEVVASERDKEPSSTNIQVLYYDNATNIEYVKTFSVTARETARCCVRLALAQLEMRCHDPAQFQLWARTGRDEAPYPLIGHERPFAIKLSALRQALSAEEGFDLDHCNNIHGTDPLTRKECSPTNNQSPWEAKKGKSNKSRKSPMRIRGVFRRSTSKNEDCVDSTDASAPGLLFELPLSRVCAPDSSPPPSVMVMLQQVFAKGPFTQGIFRKSANARLVREARARLDTGASPSSVELLPVLVTAALLKDFLRSLPDPLLTSALYAEWLAPATETGSEQQRLARVKGLLDRLPPANRSLLAHLLCVLHHVARRCSLNLMTAANLGVCVGPSLLWGPSPCADTSRAVPALVELLVSRCELLFGPGVTRLLGDPPDPLQLRQDSGAEESDTGGMRRDDSSLDSLEREELMSPPPRKDKMSLSRDSGLTMSDCQLYTPDEEESSSTSSGLSGGDKLPSQSRTPAKLPTTFSHATPPNTEYVRVYGGWEERIECCRKGTDDSVYGKARHSTPKNSNFQRQDWFRQRSHLKRLNSGGSKPSQSSGSSSSSSSSSGSGGNQEKDKNVLRRSASEESLLNSYRNSGNKRPALHSKGRAPAPPQAPPRRPHHAHYVLSRSKSAHHLASELEDSLSQSLPVKPSVVPAQCEDWARSQSTPHIAAATSLAVDEVERSYDSSTLSDDDSTPHVSRSNSRGKDCPAANNPAPWENFSIPNNFEVARRGSDLVRAAPVMATDSDPEVLPPLPPKQRRSPIEKLRHLPPVHVKLEGAGSPNTPQRRRPSSVYHPVEAAEPLYSAPRQEEPKSAPERRGRLRRRDMGACKRSKSLPPAEKQEEKVEEAPAVSEVTWSVSQLRSLFGDSRPPPYRPPPAIPSHRAPITSFHLGNSQSQLQLARLLDRRRDLGRADSRESTSEEESYV
ncbi:hypothetical protein B566_EDAN005023 [Ephemera danica]|nr:hypothetical protein B566_EDAN005023 [Ephemera danica]